MHPYETLIGVPAAQRHILDRALPLHSVRMLLSQCRPQQVLDEAIHAAIDIPGFAQSAMDGFAFHYSDWRWGQPLNIVGEVAAGSGQPPALLSGQCVRIFTGAPLPPGADTVAPKEVVRADGADLYIEKQDIALGAHVRLQGSEVRVGDAVLPAGTLLSSGVVGFLASLGVAEVAVLPPPRVSIIVTGNELVQPGNNLAYGQVYESNSFALRAALSSLQLPGVPVAFAQDTLDTVTQSLQNALETSDVVLLTGGISAGDYDFVLPAALRCGVVPVFHKVRQKPGKPLFFGVFEGKMVFGLPGNPASVLTCFYAYVRPALLQMMGHAPPMHLQAHLDGAYTKTKGFTHFLKALRTGDRVQVLGAQESFRMSSFAAANCLVVVPEEVDVLEGIVSVIAMDHV